MITTRRQRYLAATLIGALALTPNPTQAADLAGSIQGAGQAHRRINGYSFCRERRHTEAIGAGAQRC